MNSFAFPYQLLLNLNHQSGKGPLPNFFKEAIRQVDWTDFEKLEDFLISEVENSSLQDESSAWYFLSICRNSLLYFFYRRDLERLNKVAEVVRRRMGPLKSVEVIDFSSEAWEQYIEMVLTAGQRTLRHLPLESFERAISDLTWANLNEEFIADLSTILGYTYGLEENSAQVSKGRIWLYKAMNEHKGDLGLLPRLLMVQYLQQDKQAESIQSAGKILEDLNQTQAELEDDFAIQVYAAAIFEYQAALLKNTLVNSGTLEVRLENSQLRLKELETQFAQETKLPTFTQASVEGLIAELYGILHHMTDDDLEQANFGKKAIQRAEEAAALAEACRDLPGETMKKMQRIRLLIDTEQSTTEKDLKELTQYYKRQQDYPSYLKSLGTHLHFLSKNGNAHKIFDILSDIIKLGNKRIEQGGFYLINGALAQGNEVMKVETSKPGISWMVADLDTYFEKITEVIDELEGRLETIGKDLIEIFRQNYLNFEPVSHFNIKVYFLYQLYELKMARIGTLLNQDEMTRKLLDSAIKEMESENNPLSFLKADWDEFKSVPNSVRNKTLNKCINISKGDLPLAAEHLDFSYRNLRSYITFKEVNRLGFFLDMQQTGNKQLEQGIRYMFYDLYKRGTIFEVVFDMPRFLVKYAQKGFFSQDLEEELNIKGTTAKKYIKIMMEIGLIRQDKTTGRKHYYRLVRENVMNRLGQDQTTLIS